MKEVEVPRAILSVSDKTGVTELGRELDELGWELVSTGGTARVLRESGVDVLDVAAVTGHPEMMDGRVKTLHPAVHAGILARRDRPDDLAALDELGYRTIDLVVVNLYPFRQAVREGADMAAAMEQVDIGGPTMLRAAAKNHASVLVVVDPDDYRDVVDAIRDDAVDDALRRRLAARVFDHTAAYDAAISAHLAGGDADGTSDAPLPDRLSLHLAKRQDLRYGENPDQRAAFYAEAAPRPDTLPHLEQLHGKALSFNNLMDIDAAVTSVAAWSGADAPPACAIIKHTTPCGVALGTDPLSAYHRALETDPVSAFGGIVAINRAVDAPTAEALADHFLEVVVAPAFDDAALEVLTRKKNIRLIRLPNPEPVAGELDMKRVRGGLLVQDRMRHRFPEDDWRVVTDAQPSDEQWRDLRFAWRVAAVVKSNAIVLAAGEQTRGIGAGQMSRVDASRIAVMKAADQDLELSGAVLASDAFFPFRDGVDAAADAGIAAVIQPGGSIRDEEVIAAADEHGMAMILTGARVFRH